MIYGENAMQQLTIGDHLSENLKTCLKSRRLITIMMPDCRMPWSALNSATEFGIKGVCIVLP